MHFSWTPAGGPPKAPPQIGAALRGAGLITEQQLLDTVEKQKRFPYFTFGQLVSLMHRVSMAEVDAVSVRTSVLPLVAPVIMDCLVTFAAKDRFAKKLHPERFLNELRVQILHYEVMHIDARLYSNKGEEIAKEGMKRYVVTQALAKVQLFSSVGSVEGQVRVRHDSASHALELLDDMDQIKTALYYGLRNLFNRAGADVTS